MLGAICQTITIAWTLVYVPSMGSTATIWLRNMASLDALSLLFLQDAHSFFSIDIGNENHIGAV